MSSETNYRGEFDPDEVIAPDATITVARDVDTWKGGLWMAPVGALAPPVGIEPSPPWRFVGTVVAGSMKFAAPDLDLDALRSAYNDRTVPAPRETNDAD